MRKTKSLNKQEDFDKEVIEGIICGFETCISSQINALESFLSSVVNKISLDEKELIDFTLYSCKSIQNIIDMLMMVNKLNQQTLSITKPEKFNFTVLMDELIKDYEILFKYYKLNLELKCERELEFLISDKTKITKVLENLILNCINTSFKSSKIIIKATNKNNSMEVYIKTQSRYIEPQIQDEIFKKNKKYLSQYSSPMMSLSFYLINNIIIHSLFGTIQFRSYPNNTNIFLISIPVVSSVAVVG